MRETMVRACGVDNRARVSAWAVVVALPTGSPSETFSGATAGVGRGVGLEGEDSCKIFFIELLTEYLLSMAQV